MDLRGWMLVGLLLRLVNRHPGDFHNQTPGHVCIDGKIDSDNPDYFKYSSLETKEGPKRACWNSRIAPHNLEGFFLNMGEMLVKSGDWQTAQKVYENAKRTKEYPSWKYQAALDERIKQAQANVALFNSPKETQGHANRDQFGVCMHGSHQE